MACLETFASLRVFSTSVHPDQITQLLGVEPTCGRPLDPDSKYRHRREHHYWDWESRAAEKSTDGLAHINAILRTLSGKEAALEQLRSSGCSIDVCCYWVSSGQGGPSLEVQTMFELVRLGLPIWWDVYFGSTDDYQAASESSAGGA